MPSSKIKGNKPLKERYPLGELPSDVITAIGRQIIHRFAVGMADIGGDDFGGIFANAIGGSHFLKPEGVADVVWNGCSWSVKTVKHNNPFTAEKVRLISGRNSPTYSSGIDNPTANPQKTGDAVLSIWNHRINEARSDHDSLRVVVLLRCIESLKFAIFEDELGQYASKNYKWNINQRGNLEGRDRGTERHAFTWQPHGSQFTILRYVPASVAHFELRRPAMVSEDDILQKVGYKSDWVIRKLKLNK